MPPRAPEIQPISLYPEVPELYIPKLAFDKTYLRVLISLDFVHGFKDTREILQPNANQVAQDNWEYIDILEQYPYEDVVLVGEGGAGYRTILYRSHLDNSDKLFIKARSLKPRPIYEDRDMIELEWSDLLALDNYTSQFALARLIWEQEAMVPPELRRNYKFQVVIDAIEHWYAKRQMGEQWQPRIDSTIARQVASYLRTVETGTIDPDFYPEQAEDYCFARAYGYMTLEEALVRWPALATHESNRFKGMETAIHQAETPRNKGVLVDSNDHRIVMAIAMRYGFSKDRFTNPDCVTKSFPLFWELLEAAREASARSWYPA